MAGWLPQGLKDDFDDESYDAQAQQIIRGVKDRVKQAGQAVADAAPDFGAITKGLSALWEDPADAGQTDSHAAPAEAPPTADVETTGLSAGLTAPWEDPARPRRRPSLNGQPVDITMTSGPRSQDHLHPGESVGEIDYGTGGSGLSSRMDTSSREANLRQWAPALHDVERRTGLRADALAAVILAENGAGQSPLSADDNNYFSISWVQRPHQAGPGGGGRFARYNTPQDSLNDFVDLISRDQRYANAWAARGNPDQFFRELVKAGYIVEEPGFPVARWLENLHGGREEFNRLSRASYGAAGDDPGPQRPQQPRPQQPQGPSPADAYDVAFGFNQAYDNPFNANIPRHRGVDLVVRGAANNGRGAPVQAFRGGTVVAVTEDPNGGNGVIIQNPDGLYDRYFHFDSINVKTGQQIQPGQPIGVLGASGTEGFPHVHYEVSRGINGDPMDSLIDPTPYMRSGGAQAVPAREPEPTGVVAMASGDENHPGTRKGQQQRPAVQPTVDRLSAPWLEDPLPADETDGGLRVIPKEMGETPDGPALYGDGGDDPGQARGEERRPDDADRGPRESGPVSSYNDPETGGTISRPLPAPSYNDPTDGGTASRPVERPIGPASGMKPVWDADGNLLGYVAEGDTGPTAGRDVETTGVVKEPPRDEQVSGLPAGLNEPTAARPAAPADERHRPPVRTNLAPFQDEQDGPAPRPSNAAQGRSRYLPTQREVEAGMDAAQRVIAAPFLAARAAGVRLPGTPEIPEDQRPSGIVGALARGGLAMASGALEGVGAASDYMAGRFDPISTPINAQDAILNETYDADTVKWIKQMGVLIHNEEVVARKMRALPQPAFDAAMAPYRVDPAQRAEFDRLMAPVYARYAAIKDNPDELNRLAQSAPTSTQLASGALSAGLSIGAGNAVKSAAGPLARAAGAGTRAVKAAEYAAEYGGQSIVDPTNAVAQPVAEAVLKPAGAVIGRARAAGRRTVGQAGEAAERGAADVAEGAAREAEAPAGRAIDDIAEDIAGEPSNGRQVPDEAPALPSGRAPEGTDAPEIGPNPGEPSNTRQAAAAATDRVAQDPGVMHAHRRLLAVQQLVDDAEQKMLDMRGTPEYQKYEDWYNELVRWEDEATEALQAARQKAGESIPEPVRRTVLGPEDGADLAGQAERIARNALPGRGMIGSVVGAGFGAGAGAGATPEDAPWQDRVRNILVGAAVGSQAGGAALAHGTIGAARLIDSLIARGKLPASVLSSHPDHVERIRALMALAAAGLPDDAVVSVPGMAQWLQRGASMRERAALGPLLDGPVTAGQVRAIVGRETTAERLGRAATGLVVDAVTGAPTSAARAGERFADRGSVAGVRAGRGAGERTGQLPGVLTDPAWGRAVRTSDPDVADFVHGIADEMGVPRPDVYVSDAAVANAWALNHSEARPGIVISRGLMAGGSLTEQEARGLIQHELAHTVDPELGSSSLGRMLLGPVRDLVAGAGRAGEGRPTLEVLREQLAAARARTEDLVRTAGKAPDRDAYRQASTLVAMAREDEAALVNQIRQAERERAALEPRIRSDVGRKLETTTPEQADIEYIGDARRPREVVHPDMRAELENAPVDDVPRGGYTVSNAVPDAAPGGAAPRDAAPKAPGQTFAFGSKPGERIELRARVVPLSSLVTSHTDNLGINPSFPSELQPRVRERAASRLQIDRMVKEHDPAQILVDTHTVDRGPMIVGPDLVVESGNGRTIALRRLATEDPAAYARYVEQLREELPSYGLSEADLAGIDQPVLVRERVSDVDRAKFAADANVGVQHDMSPLEEAAQDAGRLSDAAVSQLAIGEGQSIDEALLGAENGPFKRAFMATIPESVRGSLIDADGNLNQRGLARAKAALLARTYTGSAGARLATALVESTDGGVTNVQRGVMTSLPAMARAEALVASGQRDAGLSLAQDVAVAVDVYTRMKRAKIAIGDYLQQAALFGDRETTPLQDRIIAYLDENARSPRRIRALLEGYADEVQRASGGDDMFGETVAVSKEEVLDGVLRRLGGDAGPDPGAELGGAGAGGPLLEGSLPRQITVPDAPTGAAPTGGAGGSSLADDVAASETLTPEQQIARLQAENDRLRAEASGRRPRQPRANGQQPAAPAPLEGANLSPVADDALPSTGSEPGALQVQGAPPQPANLPPVSGQPIPSTGGAPGSLVVQGAPAPVQPANLPPVSGQVIPPTGGQAGSLQVQGAPQTIQPANLPPVPPQAAPAPSPGYNPARVQTAAQQAQGTGAVTGQVIPPPPQGQAQPPLTPWQWARGFGATVGYTSMIGPAAFVVNMAGNALEPLWAHPKELTRAVLPQRLGGRGAPREYLEYAFGAGRGLLQTGGAVMDALASRGRYTPNPDHPMLSQQTDNPILRGLVAGIEAPNRLWSGVPDAIFGTVARSAGEARAAAQMATDAVRAGQLPADQWQRAVDALLAQAEQRRAGQLVTFPDMVDRVIAEGDRHADLQTFRTELGPISKAVRKYSGGNIPVLGNLIQPFFVTPHNMNLRLGERTPIVGAAMTTQRAFDKWYDQVVGSALVAGLVGYTVAGNVTGSGPKDTQQRRELEQQGWKAQSVRVKLPGLEPAYVPTRMFGIWAPLLNAAGEIHDAATYGKSSDGLGDRIEDAARRAGELVKDQVYLQGLSDLVSMMGGEGISGKAERYLGSLATRMTPIGSTLRTIDTALDDKDRAVPQGEDVSFLEGVYNRWRMGTGQRTTQPAAQNVMGREKANPQRGLRALLPKMGDATQADPVVQAFLDSPDVTISKPRTEITISEKGPGGKVVGSQEIPLRSHERRDWERIRGEALTEMLEQVVQSPDYLAASPQGRQKYLREKLERANEYATQQVRERIGSREIERRYLLKKGQAP